MWLRDGEQITSTDGYEIVVDGNVHKLLIRRASLEDEAEYTCMVGSEDTTGMLYVEGRVQLYIVLQGFSVSNDI